MFLCFFFCPAVIRLDTECRIMRSQDNRSYFLVAVFSDLFHSIFNERLNMFQSDVHLELIFILHRVQLFLEPFSLVLGYLGKRRNASDRPITFCQVLQCFFRWLPSMTDMCIISFYIFLFIWRAVRHDQQRNFFFSHNCSPHSNYRSEYARTRCANLFNVSCVISGVTPWPKLNTWRPSSIPSSKIAFVRVSIVSQSASKIAGSRFP